MNHADNLEKQRKQVQVQRVEGVTGVFKEQPGGQCSQRRELVGKY